MENEIIKNEIGLQLDEKLNVLADLITNEVNQAKSWFASNLNVMMVKTYWKVGHHIVEFEQKGEKKAKYGTSMLTKLAKILTVRLGRGYSRPNLNNMRKFYLLYPICQISDKLTWSQICELITIDDDLERSFYEKECIKENWNVKALRRQIESGLFLRLAASKDKEGILALAEKGVEVQKPEDIVKDTYTLEFLGLPDINRYSENDLEQRIIDNLQTFLLELGKGFAFIGRKRAQ